MGPGAAQPTPPGMTVRAAVISGMLPQAHQQQQQAEMYGESTVGLGRTPSTNYRSENKLFILCAPCNANLAANAMGQPQPQQQQAQAPQMATLAVATPAQPGKPSE